MAEQKDKKEEWVHLVEGDTNITPNRKKYSERNLSDEAMNLVNEDKKYFLHQALSTPVLNVMSKCDGPYIEDIQGRRYLDFHGNNVHNVGFSNPEIISALRKQIETGLSFCTRKYTNIPAIKLARKMAEIAPGDLCRSLFCPGGNDAIEMALKLARWVTGRFKTISMWDSFHGAGLGATSVGGEELFRGGLGPLLTGAFHVEYPDYYRNPWEFEKEEDCDKAYLHQIECIFEREHDIAAIISEPTRAAPYIPSKRYWEGVREICDKHNTLLIFDEITNNFGRTGEMFGCGHYIVPDILVYGKSFGGGILPFAGIVTREEYNDSVRMRALGHYTHEKNPLCCAVALAVIEYVEKSKLCENAAKIGEYAIERLNEMKGKHRLIGNVVGRGLLIGLDLVRNRKTKEKAVLETDMIMYKCLENGLNFKTTMGSIITLTPALTITKQEMDRALDILDKSIGEVECAMVC